MTGKLSDFAWRMKGAALIIGLQFAGWLVVIAALYALRWLLGWR